MKILHPIPSLQLLKIDFDNSLGISYNVFGLYSPPPPPRVVLCNSFQIPSLPPHQLSTSCPFLFKMTHWIQFVLSEYSQVWGHLLEHGWPTRNHNLKGATLSTAPQRGGGVRACEALPSSMPEHWLAWCCSGLVLGNPAAGSFWVWWSRHGQKTLALRVVLLPLPLQSLSLEGKTYHIVVPFADEHLPSTPWPRFNYPTKKLLRWGLRAELIYG